MVDGKLINLTALAEIDMFPEGQGRLGAKSDGWLWSQTEVVVGKT
jgi:hypothetical protein